MCMTTSAWMLLLVTINYLEFAKGENYNKRNIESRKLNYII